MALDRSMGVGWVRAMTDNEGLETRENNVANKYDDIEFPRNIPYEEVCFTSSRNYCVCYVDIVRSTSAVSCISDGIKIRKYYSIFLNSVASIARNFGAKIIKNVGDSLIFYFPESANYSDADTWKDILDCLLALIDARPIINVKLYQEDLPAINYRISADYGMVEVARSLSSKDDDLFGVPMNRCCKINSAAPANSITIGGDLYLVMRQMGIDQDSYSLTEVGQLSNDNAHPYHIYRLSEIRPNPINPFKRTSKPLALQNSKPSLPQAQNQQSKINIMLVDDEVETLITFGTILRDENYNVDTFRNGDEAIRSFITKSPAHYDLVVSDVRMSPLNGLELYGRLCELSSSVKMLFVSALDGLEEIGCLLPSLKKSQILKKPVSKEYFIQAVKSNLGHHGNCF